jgi:predicted GNAT superfamily acetyltransferase
VQIPTNIRTLKTQDMPLAQAWRQHTRQLFTDLFTQNYTVIDFIFEDGNAYYQLELGFEWANLEESSRITQMDE